jgi:hypothetical protein
LKEGDFGRCSVFNTIFGNTYHVSLNKLVTVMQTLVSKTVEYYLDGELEKQWKTELSKANGKVLVLSPYITPNLAIEVLTSIPQAYWKDCEIYTRFSLRDFVQKSSSLATLKELLDKGFQLYKLPNLHAKIILVPQQFASIGSQNLTQNSLYNQEANLITRNLEHISEIEDKIDSWLWETERITREWIEKFEECLTEFLEKQEHLDKEIKDKQEEINKQIEETNNNYRGKKAIRFAKNKVQGKIESLGRKYSLTISSRTSSLTKWDFYNNSDNDPD